MKLVFQAFLRRSFNRREGRRLCLFASRTISHFSSLGDVSSAAKREKNARSCSRKPVEAGFSDFIACRWIYLAPEWWTARIKNRAGKKLGSLKERVRRKSRGVVDRSNGATKCCIERIFSTLRRVQESYDRGKRLKFVEIFWFVDKIFYRNEM